MAFHIIPETGTWGASAPFFDMDEPSVFDWMFIKLMKYAKEIITMDVYGDNDNIFPEEMPELLVYMDEVMPNRAGDSSENNVEDVMIEDVIIELDEFLNYNIRNVTKVIDNIVEQMFVLYGKKKKRML